MTKTVLVRPGLAVGCRLHWDRVRKQRVLLFPEGALTLNQTAATVLELCDGQRDIDEIATILSERYAGADVRDDVVELLTAIAAKGFVVDASE